MMLIGAPSSTAKTKSIIYFSSMAFHTENTSNPHKNAPHENHEEVLFFTGIEFYAQLFKQSTRQPHNHIHTHTPPFPPNVAKH